MRKVSTSLFALAALVALISSCGPKVTNQVQSDVADKAGWTAQTVQSAIQSCETALTGDAQAQTYCSCVVEKSRKQLTYDQYTNPQTNGTEEQTLLDIEQQCQ